MDDNPYQAPQSNVNLPAPASIADSGPKGLGGWLILVALGLFITPVRLCVFLFQSFVPFFTDGHWAVFTDPSSSEYHPLWAPLIIFEILGNLATIAAAVFALVLFFRRSPWFPKVMIAYFIGNLVFVSADWFAADLIPAVAALDDPESSRELMRSFIACAIWVPYMCYSRRVKNTFVAPNAASQDHEDLRDEEPWRQASDAFAQH